MLSLGNAQKRWTKRPERSFGSNQVDFGGIVAPASAIAMTSEICVGIHREGDRAAPRAHALLQLARAANPADEVDAGIRARIADAEDRPEEAVLEDRDVEGGDGIRFLRPARVGVMVCQFSSK